MTKITPTTTKIREKIRQKKNIFVTESNDLCNSDILFVLYIPSETLRDGSPTTHEKRPHKMY
ncbi:MAG: hypothetical protein WCQ55_05425 [Paludibacteraceae bacterium]